MANKRTIDLTTESSVTNGMYMLVDDASFIEAKKATVEEVTEIERTARVAQDDAIEAGAGLDADGSFSPDAGSRYFTAADFVAAGYTENIRRALRLLDTQIYANASAIDGILVTVTRVLTVAEINTLYSVPVVLVDTSAWAANLLIDVIDCVAWINWGSVAWTTAKTLDIGYTGGADIMTFTNAFVVAVADTFQKATPTDNAAMKIGDVEVRFDAANPTAPPGDSEITIYLSYRIITTA